MNREQEFQHVKKLIKEHYKDASHGIFNTKNIVGDKMSVLFCDKHFSVLISYRYEYFEVFGTTDEEFQELREFYNSLGG